MLVVIVGLACLLGGTPEGEDTIDDNTVSGQAHHQSFSTFAPVKREEAHTSNKDYDRSYDEEMEAFLGYELPGQMYKLWRKPDLIII